LDAPVVRQTGTSPPPEWYRLGIGPVDVRLRWVDSRGVGIAVLGALQVDGQANGLSPRDRVVLSALVVRAGAPITTDALADALWGEDLPPSWSKVLQGCVVRLRKRLGSAAIVSAAHGYRLALADEELDYKVFERLLDRAREALAGGDPARSSYLTQDLRAGDRLEVRGPVGGWFVWRPEQAGPLQLVAGGSGVVPLMAMLRTRAGAGNRPPASLVYSTRSPGTAIYRTEIDHLAARGDGLSITWAWTREAPNRAPVGRIDAALLAAATWPPADRPTCYVCGPTGFVEAVADLLVGAGHDPGRVRTERFGPTGGTR